MQYLIIAKDGTDIHAKDRRLAVREEHVKLGNILRDAGNLLYAGAILNDSEQMIGSVLIVDFESKDKLDQWIKQEPYVTGKVWEKIEIEKFKTGPSFS